MLPPAIVSTSRCPVEVVIAALARGLGCEQAGVAGRPEQLAPVARVVIGAQRVRRAQPRGFEGLVDEPAEPVPAAQRDESAESSLAVRRRGVEHDAGHRLVPAAGIDALGDSRRAVPAFQRELADQRVREGVQQDVPHAGPFAGHQPPVRAPLVVPGGQDPAARHDRGLAFPGGEPVLAEPQEDSLTAGLRARHPGRRLARDRADAVTVGGQDSHSGESIRVKP